MADTGSDAAGPSSAEMHKTQGLKSLKQILLNLGSKLGAAEGSVWFTHLSPAGGSQHYLMRTANKLTELLSPAVIHSLTHTFLPDIYECSLCDAKLRVQWGIRHSPGLHGVCGSLGPQGRATDPIPALGLKKYFSNFNIHGNHLESLLKCRF